MDSDSQSLKPFDELFHHSFVCYDLGWNTLVHSVFGMPPGSKFLRFALESARLNFQNEEFRKRIVYLRYGPTFLGKMFFAFDDRTINIIDSRYLIWNHNNTQNYMMQVTEIKRIIIRSRLAVDWDKYLTSELFRAQKNEDTYWEQGSTL